MTVAEVVARYRRFAADWYSIAQLSDDPAGKLSALDMALAWLELAERTLRMKRSRSLRSARDH